MIKINYTIIDGFCILILGRWSNPSIIGQCIPPASNFIMEKIDNTRAVLFGGIDDDAKDTFSNSVYLLEISISTVVC